MLYNFISYIHVVVVVLGKSIYDLNGGHVENSKMKEGVQSQSCFENKIVLAKGSGTSN